MREAAWTLSEALYLAPNREFVANSAEATMWVPLKVRAHYFETTLISEGICPGIQ
jgi:hypothetical protein